MSNKRRALLLIVLPMIMAMRDPFLPPEDRCHTAQLAQWRYQGVIERASGRTGLLRNPQGVWLRVQTGSHLSTGWRVVQLTSQELVIETGAGCDPARWSWSRQGEQHESRDRHFTPHNSAAGVGTKAAAGHAGGG